MMEVKIFRKIGFIYAVICFLGSTTGAIIFFKRLVDEASRESYLNHFYQSDYHLIVISVIMIVFMLSAMFSIFIKIGIEEAQPSYIRLQRVFMLVRNFVLIVRWSYHIVMLQIARTNGDHSLAVVQDQNITSAFLITIAVILGLELWIIDGAERYVMEQFHGERSSEA
ncbi:uncharacterized protein LOC129770640 [Toxorhynchites rutilus septentrionalis]|uniref:uncharacterized protein LOC129770640 n=1 Tax=Toxorhynchites rutilus septentrionalis TaxID=329112 RepID=UPI00247A31C2|nr:uncharacterized protein LOC129770640 [Toxorhynchites rutilus septentrionalis]